MNAVAWDIDGTLMDSESLHLHALIAVSKRYGVDLSAEPEERFRGVHMSDVWFALHEEFPGSLTEERWNGEIVDWYVENAERLTPMPGAVETVNVLARMGVAQFCVSNLAWRVVDTNIERLGIGSLLAGSISVEDVMRGKPDPEPYLKAVSALGVPRTNVLAVLAVEDSPTGARAARSARLRVAFYRPEGDKSPSFDGADIEINDLTALPVLPDFLRP